MPRKVSKKKEKVPGSNSPVTMGGKLEGEKVKSPPTISKRGWKIILSGIVVVIAGFYILSLADARGQNWASTVSPLLIVGGYALIGLGIMSKGPVPTASN